MYEVMMNFKDVEKQEKVAEIKYKGKFYSISVSVNPRSKKVLASIAVDRKIVIQSAVCINNQSLLYGYAGLDIETNIDFMFASLEGSNIGNSTIHTDLGNKVKLYLIDNETE